MADIVNLDDRRLPPNPGNGAREALIDVLHDHRTYLARKSDEDGCDVVLAQLWMRGFKVVPLDDDNQ